MTFPILKGLFRYELTDHYAILGVPINAEVDKIRERYLKIAYRLHPDTCKAKSTYAKQKAGQLLSRLVNPSYEKLSREATRSEYLIVLSQTSRMITEKEGEGVESAAAKKLLKLNKDLDLAYFKLVMMLIEHQYDDLDKIQEKIAEISELNLVYLLRKQGQNLRSQPKKPPVTTNSAQPLQTTEGSITQSVPDKSATTSPIEIYLRRAQECLDKGNYDQIILEMRDALKIEPKNGKCHAFMALAYLRKQQLPMAKVHVNTALKAEPYDPIVRQASQEYRKLAPHDTPSKSSKKQEDQSKKTGFWNWTKFNK